MVHRSVTPFPPAAVTLCKPGEEEKPKVNLTSYPPMITVCYSLGIYLLNLFLAFLQPKIDPSLTQDEGLEDGDAGSSLPTKKDEEFRPFIRRLPEFKFWHSATRAIAISFFCTWFSIFNVPVFWPVLVVYFLILFSLTSEFFFSPRCPSFSPFRLCVRMEWVFWEMRTIADGQHFYLVRRQIQHMIKYRYVPFSFGKAKYNQRSGH